MNTRASFKIIPSQRKIACVSVRNTDSRNENFCLFSLITRFLAIQILIHRNVRASLSFTFLDIHHFSCHIRCVSWSFLAKKNFKEPASTTSKHWILNKSSPDSQQISILYLPLYLVIYNKIPWRAFNLFRKFLIQFDNSRNISQYFLLRLLRFIPVRNLDGAICRNLVAKSVHRPSVIAVYF